MSFSRRKVLHSHSCASHGFADRLASHALALGVTNTAAVRAGTVTVRAVGLLAL